MHRYFFNFRQGDELSRDRIGMYLPSLDSARAEAVYAWRQVIALAAHSGETPDDCEIQIADESGDTVLSILLGERVRLH